MKFEENWLKIGSKVWMDGGRTDGRTDDEQRTGSDHNLSHIHAYGVEKTSYMEQFRDVPLE